MAGEEKITRQLKVWLRQNIRQLSKGLASLLVALLLFSCANRSQPVQLLDLPDIPQGKEVRRLNGSISEVAPPAIFSDLDELTAGKQPQLEINYPKPNQVIGTTSFTTTIKLRDLSIYKDENLNLGPHLQVSLDDQPARSIYSLDEPIEFSDLSPGTHTLRAIAVKPWGESFKNEAAYAQTTFHILADTGANAPDPNQPQLAYIQPQGTYGAQPILLDFYLLNAPLHDLAQSDPTLTDWKIRCQINGESFIFDQWQPIYLKGFKPGQNWVQITLIDEQGEPIKNAFNSTVRLINYDPEQRDTLAQLTRSELSIEAVGQIVDPSYEPPVEVPEVPEVPEVAPEKTPEKTPEEASEKTPEEVPEATDTETTDSQATITTKTINDAVEKTDKLNAEDTAAESKSTPPILLNEDPIIPSEIEDAAPSKIVLDQESDIPTLLPSEDKLTSEHPSEEAVNSFDSFDSFAADRPNKRSVESTGAELKETDATKAELNETEPVEAEPVETEPVETEPVETEPLEAEPANIEPVKELTEPQIDSPSISIEQSLENALEDTSEDLEENLKDLRESTEAQIEETLDEFQESTEGFLKTQTPNFFERLQTRWQQLSSPLPADSRSPSEQSSTNPEVIDSEVIDSEVIDSEVTEPEVTVEVPVTTNPLDELPLPNLSDEIRFNPDSSAPDSAD
ncbi:MAG: hypothetical protein HLUCCA11_14995 [Phormidesmis priestleyi Ana]|uniref:FHA domain containing protein n=1 Tax=Phormidesmis priestleyi Ana TaxID=1666911 RepID=A0A0P7YUX5_9CYAN|nr:MAG: hypothetical protein HLUCCA11_14995 [Phormidesmis priestleyi Ana]